MFARVIDHDFAVWAFGDKWQLFLDWEADVSDLMWEWNRLHGTLHRIDVDDYIQEGMKTIKQIYNKEMGHDEKKPETKPPNAKRSANHSGKKKGAK